MRRDTSGSVSVVPEPPNFVAQNATHYPELEARVSRLKTEMPRVPSTQMTDKTVSLTDGVVSGFLTNRVTAVNFLVGLKRLRLE